MDHIGIEDDGFDTRSLCVVVFLLSGRSSVSQRCIARSELCQRHVSLFVPTIESLSDLKYVLSLIQRHARPRASTYRTLVVIDLHTFSRWRSPWIPPLIMRGRLGTRSALFSDGLRTDSIDALACYHNRIILLMFRDSE